MRDLKGTDFQKMVWIEIKKIPKGKTITYKELAIAKVSVACCAVVTLGFHYLHLLCGSTTTCNWLK